MAALGFVRGGEAAAGLDRSLAALILFWDAPGAEIAIRRGPVESPDFPGKNGIVSSLEVRGSKGSVRFFTLGKGDQNEIAQSHRQLMMREGEQRSLRMKTEDREALRSLLGAAVLRPEIAARAADGAPRLARSFSDVGALAERFRKVLEIDQALFLLDGWSARAAGESAGTDSACDPAKRAGGDEGLLALSKRVRELGFLFGLVAECPEDLPGSLARLKERAAPDLLLYRAPSGLTPKEPAAGEDSLGERIRNDIGIAATDGAGEGWVRGFGYLEGLLSHKALRPLDPVFPLFAFSYGNAARITVRPEDAVEPGEPEKVLAHLILGEVPLYALPPERGADVEAPPGDPRFTFARSDGGWTEGKGLSARERFIKNTYEVLSHVARIRFRAPLLFHRYLTPDRTVEETYFGPDLRVVVNYGEREYKDQEGDFTLPRFGFWVQHPFFHAFFATRAHGVDYEKPALFTVRSLEGKLYLRAEAVRIYHGFGPTRIQLGGREFDIQREQQVKIW